MKQKKPGRPRGEPKKMIATRISLKAYLKLLEEAKRNGKTIGAEIATRFEV